MNALRRRWDEARFAMMLLTRIPVGRIQPDIPLSDARWAYPLVGVPVGLLGGGVLIGAFWIGTPPAVAAVLVIAALALATGGLHHDGLADFADALGGATREKRLAILRDSRIGSYGVLALGLTLAALGAAFVAVGPMLAAYGPLIVFGTFITFAVASRVAMLTVLVVLPPARKDGLGRAAHGAGRGVVLPGAFLALAGGVLLGPMVQVPLVVGAVLAGAIALSARRLLGGQTGDVLGATQLGFEAAAWTALSIVFGPGA